MYENDSAAEMYDLLYQDRKDYPAEAERVARLVRERNPGARSLLDVACGTGIHLRAFAELFERVEGVDLSRPMLDVAAGRLRTAGPKGVPLHLGDMRELRIEGRFDAVVCMFSSIGYLRSTDDLDRAVGAMSRRLEPGGVLVIEPWYFPETFLEGHVSGHALTRDGRTITRVSHSTREGDATRMELHYVLADAGGVLHRSEIDRLTLFTREQYEAAYRRAELKPEYLETSGAGPGFFVGTGA
ncbi:class I SAM-dependent DNA methyltransferase [Streptomyces sp. TP-A0874]|uniref:class I SAM-dependent DNA methyltransferase n=1 Tax=Streptomyces sp. TP-A0874 TaxID=549819 RepID=UPI000853E67C|nr:class I SAM-dependent methyltransferase [Streptomyces sp. TP-A0874]